MTAGPLRTVLSLRAVDKAGEGLLIVIALLDGTVVEGGVY